MGHVLSAIGAMYFNEMELFSDVIAYETEVSQEKQISEGITGYKPRVISLFGAPIGISPGAFCIDVDTDIYGVVACSEGAAGRNAIFNFMFLEGLVGSYLESSILEQTVGIPSVSAVKILEMAYENGTDIRTFTPYNTEELDELAIDSTAKDEIRASLRAGKTVIVPEADICYHDWKGVGYIAFDADTGAGAYMISGGYCGGYDEGGSESKIGDFTNLEWSTIDDILDRIPDEATFRELYPVEGGATEGFEFKWVQDGQTYRVRVHNADPGAPAGSNAANGWTLRIQRGTQYYDYTINDFQPARFTNPNGPFFDETIMNNTHIPILDPYAK